MVFNNSGQSFKNPGIVRIVVIENPIIEDLLHSSTKMLFDWAP